VFKKRIKKALILVFFLSLLFALALFIYQFGCVFRQLTHIPCPTCGMSRAIISLMKLDFASYFYYNAFALPVLFSIIVLAFSKHFNKQFFVFAILILILNFIYYIYRLIYAAIP
jgi:hypothetical protein